MKETLLRAAFAAARFVTCATDEQRQRPPSFRDFCTFAVATAPTLALALSVCACSYWYRQNADAFNSGYRTLSMGASDFSKPTLQKTIPTPDGAVVGAVNLSRDDTELYVTEGSDSGFKPYGFAIFNRATGMERCHKLFQGTIMWSSPTGGNSDDVFIAGGSGNIWRFSTKIGNNKDCALEPGWPVQTKNNLTITGPVLVRGDQVIAAAQDGHVAMFKYDNPVSPALGFDVHVLVDPKIPNGSPLEGWQIVGSPALATVQDENGTVKTLLLLSISSTAGALVGVDVDAMTLAGMFPTGPLTAGPSVALIGDGSLTTIAVVPESKLIVHGIRIDKIMWAESDSWIAKLASQLPQGDQFKTEASVTNGNVFLTSSSSLIGLDLATGQAKWAPVLLDSSAAQAPAVADNGNIYLAVGFKVEAFSSSTGKKISETNPEKTQGVLILRPSIANDGSVLVGDSKSILKFR